MSRSIRWLLLSLLLTLVIAPLAIRAYQQPIQPSERIAPPPPSPAQLAAQDASPASDATASAEYRAHLLRVLTARALEELGA